VNSGGNLAQHDDGSTLHDGNTAETFAVLEGVDDERLLRLEDDLGHFVGLQGDGVLEFLVSGFFSNLPVDLDHSYGGTASTDEGDGAITVLQLSRVIQNTDLGGEGLDSVDGGVRLEDHDVSNTRHVLLLQTFDVETAVVTRDGSRDRLVVHFDGEDLSIARSGGGVSGQEDDFLSRLDGSLLDTAGQHITDTLDLVDTRDGGSGGAGDRALRDDDEFLEAVEESINVNGDFSLFDISSLPPSHVGGLGDQVVSLPARNGEERYGVGDKVLQPTDTEQHTLHLFLDFGVTGLLVSGEIGIHLVDSNKDLLNTEQVDQQGVLTSLSLDFSGLVVSTGNGGGEISVGRHHEEGDIGLRGTSDHVLDKITMSRGVDDGVVLGGSEKFLGGASNGHTTLTFLLLTIHVEGKSERSFSESLSFFSELDHLTLRDSTEFEDEATSRGRFTSIYMSTDDD